MGALTSDTSAVAQILRKRDFTEDQATGVVEAFREIDASSLATEADLREVEVRLERVEAKIEASAANSKLDILRWLVVTQIARAGFIFAAMKFVK